MPSDVLKNAKATTISHSIEALALFELDTFGLGFGYLLRRIDKFFGIGLDSAS